MLETIEDVTLIPEPTDKRLEPTQKVRYRQFRKRFREWLHTIGKNPGRGEGYALTTIKSRMYRADKFFRWVWANETDGFTLQITTAHADAFMEHLAKSDQGRSYKADLQKAVKAYFRFDGTEWEPQIAFSDPSRPSVAKSVLTPDEWRRVREAAASYGARIVSDDSSFTDTALLTPRFYTLHTPRPSNRELNPSCYSSSSSFRVRRILFRKCGK
jgi:hypothetical protein